jgi:hypothetical protein
MHFALHGAKAKAYQCQRRHRYERSDDFSIGLHTTIGSQPHGETTRQRKKVRGHMRYPSSVKSNRAATSFLAQQQDRRRQPLAASQPEPDAIPGMPRRGTDKVGEIHLKGKINTYAISTTNRYMHGSIAVTWFSSIE